MERTSFALLAEAVRGAAVTEGATLAHLRIEREGELDDMELRHKRVWAASDLIARLAEHEPIIRGLLKVGALVDFPHYSTDVRALHAGDVWLIKVLGNEVHQDEVRVTFRAKQFAYSSFMYRSDVIGVMRRQD